MCLPCSVSSVLGATGHPAPWAALCLPALGGRGGGSCHEPARSQRLQRPQMAMGREGGLTGGWGGGSWCSVCIPLSTAPLHWLTLRWSCVTVSWPSTGTKCHMSILTKDCEWRLPQQPSHPSGLLPPPFPHPLSRVRGTVQPRSVPPPSTFSAAFFHCGIRI